jgi:cell division protein ZapE
MTEQVVIARYRALLAERSFSEDAAQLAAAQRLQVLADELAASKPDTGFFARFKSPPAAPNGVWMHGGVGRGKSFLMDCFYTVAPVRRKTRIHFHEFMRGVHRELRELKGTKNPLDAVAKRVARRYRLICFDEFHVSDIADAMILERLLRALFELRVVFVMTSNYVPDNLYPDGLHRDRLLPAIKLLNQHLDVIGVDVGIDYRRLTLAGLKTYHFPLNEDSRAALEQAYASIAEVSDDDPELVIENRPIRAIRRAGGIGWFDFETLCGGPRSQIDYLEIAQQFHTVLLSDVPQLTPGMSAQARRFLWLIDVLYDQRVTLMVSAQCEPAALYTEGTMAHEFERTVSRLLEMQSQEYLNQPRRGVSERIS